ncbi:uncharacterized protein LOC124619268 [Schistocerca americana]|uniref:uncharacterized protein LOC124619268 n=1 Tax=Schistocerca americana TaxID=7009 RepID=UPI001F4FE5A6|nr:uncharacterized protein LOC124619268 [Schistocerca americana]
MPTGGVMDTKRPGRPSTSVSEKKVATLREMFKSNPSKSTRWGLLTASTIFYMNRNSSSEWKELSRRSFNLFSNLTLLSSRDFTSLVVEKLDSMGTFLTGTIQRNRKFLPPNLLSKFDIGHVKFFRKAFVLLCRKIQFC